MGNQLRLRLAGLFFLIPLIAFSQAGDPPVAATPPEAATPPDASAQPASPAKSGWTRKGVDIYLLGDGYGDLNFNHPASGFDQLYNFDDKANTVHLNLSKIALEKTSGVLGFRVDAGVGRTLDLISATDDAPHGFRYLEQMFVEFRPPKTHGLQIDFGKFVTSAGAEVIESNNNWNYSRSLLFALAIPYYHFGVRATLPVTKTFTAGLQVVNGWNSLGTNNGFRTVGVVGNFAWKKVAWFNNYYTGTQEEGLIRAYRQVYDTTVTLTPNDKANVYVNFDLGSDKQPGATRQKWSGVAIAGRYQLTKRFAFAPRFEYFDDMDGFSTGSIQDLREVTLTGEAKIFEHLLSRLEYRRDMSDRGFFDRGAGIQVAKSENTLSLALIAFFGPKK